MALRWPTKDPDETLDYSVDWSRHLGEETITSITWYVSTPNQTKTQIDVGETLTVASGAAVTDSIKNASVSNTSTVATIFLAGGEVNTEYTFYCNMTDTGGRTVERSIKIVVREN